jgi:hypothetical protein
VRRFAFALLLVPLLAACASWMAPRPRERAAAAVALVAQGTALDRPAVRDAVVRALVRTSGRPVVRLDGLAAPADPEVRALAARVRKSNPTLGAAELRETRCRDGAAILTALVRRVDAVYRVTVDRRESVRARRAGEPRALLGALGVRGAARCARNR